MKKGFVNMMIGFAVILIVIIAMTAGWSGDTTEDSFNASINDAGEPVGKAFNDTTFNEPAIEPLDVSDNTSSNTSSQNIITLKEPPLEVVGETII